MHPLLAFIKQRILGIIILSIKKKYFSPNFRYRKPGSSPGSSLPGGCQWSCHNGHAGGECRGHTTYQATGWSLQVKGIIILTYIFLCGFFLPKTKEFLSKMNLLLLGSYTKLSCNLKKTIHPIHPLYHIPFPPTEVERTYQ